VNHNTAEILKECIESVFKFEDETTFEIIIVDNASTDNSPEVISVLDTKHKNVKSILLKKDDGFSHANNVGYNESSSDFVLIMNPDIIFTESILGKLVKDFEENNELGAVSPVLTGKDGNFQRNYFQRYPTVMQFLLFHSIFGKFFHRFPSLMNRYLENQDVNPKSGKMEYVEQIPCAFFLTKRDIFESVGRMDEGYKLFFEDVDLSYQINKKYKLGIDTSTSVTHLGGESFKTEDNWWLYGRFITGMLYFFKKNYSRFRSFILEVSTFINSFLIISIEHLKKLFGGKESYRLKKHKHFLDLQKSNRDKN
jgi:GT2 family glycosyltransferase